MVVFTCHAAGHRAPDEPGAGHQADQRGRSPTDPGAAPPPRRPTGTATGADHPAGLGGGARDRFRRPPTGCRCTPGSGSTTLRRWRPTWPTSVSHMSICPRSCSPAPGSSHGYDVVDHSQLNTEAGGREAFDRMSAALREHGLSAVADVVPNHMAVPTPVRLKRGTVVGAARRAQFTVRALVRRRLERRTPSGAHAGARRTHRHGALARGVAGRVPRRRAGVCGTAITSSRCDRAPPGFRSRSWSTGSGTGWPGGGSARRS